MPYYEDMICVEYESVISSNNDCEKENKRGQSTCFHFAGQKVYKILGEDTGGTITRFLTRRTSPTFIHPNWVLTFSPTGQSLPYTLTYLSCFNHYKALKPRQ